MLLILTAESSLLHENHFILHMSVLRLLIVACLGYYQLSNAQNGIILLFATGSLTMES